METAERQTTLAKETGYQGVGLHTGQMATIKFLPAPEDHGIAFRRVDLPGAPLFPVTWKTVTDGIRGTNVQIDGHTIYTIEHILAACSGLSVDNLLMELDAAEPPVADGSSLEFVRLFKEAGLKQQDALRSVYRLRKSVAFSDDRASVTAVPADTMRVSYTLQYSNPVIGCQFKEVKVEPEEFCREIMGARTFCLKEEVDQLRQRNLALGGSLENAVVVDDDKILNDELRYPDEFVRHKLLDLIGDLYVAGKHILGHFIAHRSGHKHNVRLVKKLFDTQAIDLETATDPAAQFDIRRIWELLPHRFPFLLVDRILELDVGVRAVGMKNVSINEPYFQGHFPHRPIMPGVLVMEALAQVAGVCIMSIPEHRGKTPFFTGLDSVHFRKPITPGDQIRLEIEVDRLRGKMGRVRGKALVDGRMAAEGVLKFTVI